VNFKKNIGFILLFIVFLTSLFSAYDTNAQTTITPVKKTIQTGFSTGTVIQNTDLYLVDMDNANCTLDKGFISQIVSCIKYIVNGTITDAKITLFYNAFKDIGAGAVVLYIMFFGFKLMFGGVEKVRSEAFIVFITASFIVFFNQAAQITTYTKVFQGIQEEFVSVAVSAINPREIAKLDSRIQAACASITDPVLKNTCLNTEIDSKISDEESINSGWASTACISVPAYPDTANEKCQRRFLTASDSKSACSLVAAADKVACEGYYAEMQVECPIMGKDVWRKIDCLIPKILGAHPLAEKMTNCISGLFMKSDETTGIKLNASIPGISEAGKLLSRECVTNLNVTPRDPNLGSGDEKTAKNFYGDKNRTIGGMMQSTIFSLFIILAGTMFFSKFGLLIVVSGIAIPVLIIVAFAQAAYVYLTSFIAIAILGLFAPIILPCFLFKQTRSIFDSWLRIIISMTIKPGILLVYLSFMLYILTAVINYGGMGNNSFRSYSDFVAGKAFENTTMQEVAWGRITKKYGNLSSSYSNMKEEKNVVDVRSKAQIFANKSNNFNLCNTVDMPSENNGFQVVITQNAKDEFCKIEAEQRRFQLFIESIFDQYYGSVKTSGQFSQELKLPMVNLGNVNTIEMGVHGVMKDLVRLSEIPTFVIEGTNGPFPNFVLAPGKSPEDLKKAILNNDKIFPTCAFLSVVRSDVDCNSRYGDEFVKRIIEKMANKNSDEFQFLISMLVIIVVLGITLTFMNNVIEFGDQLAGLAGVQAMSMSNIYGMVSHKFNSIIFK
jgi:hypothetical protein